MPSSNHKENHYQHTERWKVPKAAELSEENSLVLLEQFIFEVHYIF